MTLCQKLHFKKTDFVKAISVDVSQLTKSTVYDRSLQANKNETMCA